MTEFGYQRDFVVADQQADALNIRLGYFAHELRNLLSNATLALAVIKAGNVGLTGATGAVLDRSLVGLRNLIDRSLAEVRMTAGLPVQHELFSLAEFIGEVKLAGELEAQVKGCVLFVSDVDPRLAVDADRDLMFSAVGNLLQNAFKFTHPGTEVTLNAYAMADRILIDVEDNCGGLPAGDAERMFRPFTQGGDDKSGLGLGLSIAAAASKPTAASSACATSPARAASSPSTCPATRCRTRWRSCWRPRGRLTRAGGGPGPRPAI